MSVRVIASKFTAIDRYSATVRKMQHNLSSFSKKAQYDFARVQKSAKRLKHEFEGINRVANRGLVIGGGAAIAGATALVTKFVREASKIEDATAAFTPLMGGAEQAAKLVARLNKEASTTPYQFKVISEVAQQLLPVMNQDIELTAKTFRMLGDTAGGSMDQLTRITRGYSKALLKGKPDMESLNMIGEAGVPILRELSKSLFGVADKTGKVMEMSRRGTLTNKDLTKTFEAMTSKGGIFFKGMEIASKTLTGRLSTLKDNINLAFAALGTTALPILKTYADRLIDIASTTRTWVENNQDLVKTRMDKFFSRIKTILQKVWEVGKFVYKNFDTILSAVKGIAIAIGLMKIAMIGFNIVTWANPFGAIAGAIGLAIVGITMLIDKTDGFKSSLLGIETWFNNFKSFFYLGGLQLEILFTKFQLFGKGVGNIFMNLGEVFKAAFSGNFDKIQGILKQDNPYYSQLAELQNEFKTGIVDLQLSNITNTAKIRSLRTQEEINWGARPEAISNQVTKEQRITETLINKSRVDLFINDSTGKASMGDAPKGIGIFMNDTSGQKALAE